jgi:hypothetical protein
MAINLDHVTEQITVTDTAANASLTVNPKGTGAFNIAAGSGGLNLSNGGTVTALTLSGVGYGYTTQTSAAISAPTTANGVQATATVTMGINTASVASGGTGYAVGNVLSVVGGTSLIGAATLTVTAVSGGVITAVSSTNFAAYSALPSSPVSVTGGSGSGATFNPLWFTASFIITNAGSGYVEQPTVTFSGGGGSGAAAYATVGSNTSVKSLGTSLLFYTPAGVQGQFSDSGGSTPTAYPNLNGSSFGLAYLTATGSAANAGLVLASKGASAVGIYTNSTGSQAASFSHTASAVNYVQVTGAATASGTGPVISAQGSDTNVNLTLQSKGTGYLNVLNNRTNYFQFYGGNTGQSPTMYVWGSDANVDLNLTTKGTGVVNLNTGNGIGFRVFDGGATSVNYWSAAGGANAVFRTVGNGAAFFDNNNAQALIFRTATSSTQFQIAHTASAVNYVQVTGAATGGSPTISVQGSDAGIALRLNAKGGSQVIFSGNGANTAFQTNHVTSAVNFLQATPSATGFGPNLNAQGSDTNIPLVLQPKGTGALQAQQTDSTATGGNARGANAVDWQTSRVTANQVASGQYSVTSGGYGNIASAFTSFVGGGYTNTASGYNATVAGGTLCVGSGPYSSVLGGYANTTSNFFAAISGGVSNTAAGYYNFIGGGFTNSGTALAAVTTQSATMNGTTAVTLAASNANIKVGQYITGTSIGADTYVFAISGTSLTLSKVASGSSTSTLSFFTPHGVVVGGGNNTATGSYSFIGGGGDAGAVYQRNVASGDWSTVVGGIDNVASGIASFVGGGGTYTNGFINGNTSSGDFAVTGGGLQNFSSGFGSAVLGGFLNSASTTYTVVAGGQQNSASNLYAFAGGGVANVANGIASTVVGGYYGITRGITGYQAFPACVQPVASASGVSQGGLLILGRQTTDATATRLTSDVNSAGIVNQVILPNNSAYFFTGEVVAGVTGGGNTKGWTIEGVIKRGANAASTALVGTPTVTSTYADAGASTWVIAVTADTTNGGLAVTFTGQASTTIRTVAKISTVEMTF